MYSCLIQKAKIIDGTGKPGFIGDVAIEDDVIVEVAPHLKSKAVEIIDAQGLVLSPGFIDIQNHSDSYWQMFDSPGLDSLVAQGITTILIGNCGGSLAPILSPESLLAMQKWHSLAGANINWVSFEDFAREIIRQNFGCNIASLVGYATIRRGLVGDNLGSLEQGESEALKRVVWDSLEAGAFGLSTGLSYAHEIGISDIELLELAKIVASFNAMLSVHLRNEGSEVVESAREAIELGMHSGVNVKISHLKVKGPGNFIHFEDLLSMLEVAYSRGVRVGFDVYPYTSVWQPLYTYLPKWAIEHGRKQLVAYLSDAEKKKKILSHLENSHTNFGGMTIASTAHPLSMHGKTIGAIARNMNITSEEAAVEIIDKGGSEVLVFDEALSIEQVQRLLVHPMGFVATDGAGFSASSQYGLSNKLVHPRCFGTMPNFLRYVLSSEVMPVERAIWKLTGAVAEKVGLNKRGIIKPGNFADLVLFDPKNIQDHATYKNPYQYPSGIASVWVNGKLALNNGRVSRYGRFLRKAK